MDYTNLNNPSNPISLINIILNPCERSFHSCRIQLIPCLINRAELSISQVATDRPCVIYITSRRYITLIYSEFLSELIFLLFIIIKMVACMSNPRVILIWTYMRRTLPSHSHLLHDFTSTSITGLAMDIFYQTLTKCR